MNFSSGDLQKEPEFEAVALEYELMREGVPWDRSGLSKNGAWYESRTGHLQPWMSLDRSEKVKLNEFLSKPFLERIETEPVRLGNAIDLAALLGAFSPVEKRELAAWLLAAAKRDAGEEPKEWPHFRSCPTVQVDTIKPGPIAAEEWYQADLGEGGGVFQIRRDKIE